MSGKNMLRKIIYRAGIVLIGLTIFTPAFGRISQLPFFTSGGSSGLIYNNPLLDNASIVYRASFTADDWSGQLKAYHANADGSVGARLWDAEKHIPGWKVRNIATWNPETNSATDFQWSGLTGQQKTTIGSNEMLAYVRGDPALEASHQIGHFRSRKSRLGDIVNSLPIYVKNTHLGYTALADIHGGGSIYQDYERAKSARTAMLYVGANDGMLHAFEATTGAERFAYIPHAVFPHLHLLSDPNYKHKHHYFVDGKLTEGDAYLQRGSASTPMWKTIVLGSTGAGAKSVFALDVSSPDALSAKSVMWERSDTLRGGVIDNDMGHVFGEAAVVRLRNGQWAALYGNGYDSKNNKATLYLVNVADGSLIKKIHTEHGGKTAPNGLSTPALLFNAHREVIAAYAGDLRGNVWKFDLESTDPHAWTVGYQRRPLYVAHDRQGKPQPIVQQPVMARHPNGGRMIMFGTGKLFEISDPADTQVQAVYALWEKPDGVTTIDGAYQLQQQTLSRIEGGRTISKNAINWRNQRGWYVELPDRGERVVGKLQILNGMLVIMTMTPGVHTGLDNAPSSELMLIDFTTGSTPSKAPFPTLPPHQMSIRVPASISSPVIVTQPNGKRGLVIQAMDGRVKIVPLAVTPRIPLRTWHQLAVPF
ncbi:pilus assembly protein [Glaciimonas sp. GNP009]